ncbi:hypothetical protein GRI43_01995 [Altererythrobacter luteolus]|uniref:Uncharacterized protein n=1 Tax=Pontixanthobacter luteolus TaxID=295089 RepID=A0A6I4V1A5_9SPHN|nr:hypothetical protein [Pontixanthobacter luteolus]MXP46164.1 hypothetical protein [Pontixanthobacter luteolus]
MSAETMFAEKRVELSPRRARRGPGERLRTALLVLAEGHGEVAHHQERGWASITFSGTRHTVQLVFAGDAAVEAGENFVAALPDHEFTLSGQLVADAAIISVEHSQLPEPRMLVECELLLLLDG